jgi:hypothetical protein
MDGFSFIFGAIVFAAISAAVAGALGASTLVMWLVGICAAVCFGWAALKYDT